METLSLGRRSEIKTRLLEAVTALLNLGFEADGFSISYETACLVLLMQSIEYGYDAMASDLPWADRPGFAGVQKDSIRRLAEDELRFLREHKLTLYGALFTYYDLLVAMLRGPDRSDDARLIQ